jgi:ABC-type proline/glycine betaine transport system ATPase subunit
MDRMKEWQPIFAYPRLFGLGSKTSEIGEIERLAITLGEPKKEFVSQFLQATLKESERAHLVPLDEDIWQQLKNTDSLRIAEGDWNAVKNIIGETRDWRALKAAMMRGERIDAPIIVKIGTEYHKVSGNTRLMVARALGIRPKVLLVDLS